jgi:type I restriction enzyme, R subunit
MAKINESERTAQDRVVRFFQKKLNYDYYGNLHSQINTNIIIEKLTAYLTEHGYSASLSKKAIDDLVSVAGNLQQGLYKANQDVYSLLKYGAKVKENPGEPDKTVYFIDKEY